MIGRKVSHFRILEQVGGGGMGRVFKAQDERLPRSVALKFLPLAYADDKQFRVRLEREANAASALDHPNICTIHEIDETEDGQLFIAMAFCEGENLKERLRRGPLPIDEATQIALQAADGLAAAHQQNIIHRDIKPANLMVTRNSIVKIVDFGLAKREGQTGITGKHAVLGTPLYMSPEQLRGEEVDRRSDVWALGVVLYKMLTGEMPFTGDYGNQEDTQVPDPVANYAGEVPEELDNVLEKSLAKNPKDRFQDGEEMAAALREVRFALGYATDGTSVTETWQPPREPRRAMKWQRWVAAAAVLIVVALGVWLAMDWSDGAARFENPEAQKLYEQGRNYERQGYTPAKMQTAEDLYRRALEIEPENAVIQAQLASVLSRLQRRYPEPGRAKEIEQLVEQALSHDPDPASAWEARGTLRLVAGDNEAAENAARRAITLDPNDSRGQGLLGEALIAQNRIDEGLAQLRTAVETSQDFVWARELLGFHLMELGRDDEAMGEFEKVLEYDPYSPTALNNLAVIYQIQGRDSDAVPLLNQLLKLQPEDDSAAGNLGIAYTNLGRLEEAIEILERAHELAPDKPQHMYSLADCYQRMDNRAEAMVWFEQAVAAYDRALEAGGNLATLVAPRAVCLAKLHRFDEAIPAIEEALAFAGSQTEPLFRAAQVYALAGDDEKTLEFMRRSLAVGHSRAWYRSDSAFAAYQGKPAFEKLLEHTVAPR